MAETPPEVDVILPVYNGEGTIEKTLESLIAQSRPPDRIIIVNDGSADKTQEILRRFGSRPDIVLLEHDTNLGHSAALNTGIEASTGDFIAIADADDIYHPDRISAQLRLFSKFPEADVIGFAAGNEQFKPRWLLQTRPELIRAGMCFRNQMVHPSVMFRASNRLKRKLRYNTRFRRANDYELWSHLMVDFNFINVNKSYIYYNLNNSFNDPDNRIQEEEKKNILSNILHYIDIQTNSQYIHAHYLLGGPEREMTADELRQIADWVVLLVSRFRSGTAGITQDELRTAAADELIRHLNRNRKLAMKIALFLPVSWQTLIRKRRIHRTLQSLIARF